MDKNSSTCDICLITPGNVSSNPRLVKEADALVEAGYATHVIAGNFAKKVADLDHTILKRARWSYTLVKPDSYHQYFALTAFHKLARFFISCGMTPGLPLAIVANSRRSLLLYTAGRAIKAKMYLAHNLPALPAASRLAKLQGTLYGFDAEDFHVGELEETKANQMLKQVRQKIERDLLPGCSHLTASSPQIAAAYQTSYNVTPLPILNVFPRSEFQDTAQRRAPNSPPSLYWFSQTVSLDRGLQPIIRALDVSTREISLSIRGFCSKEVKQSLLACATRNEVRARIHFLAPAAPDQMIRLAAEHDLGLSLEEKHPENKRLCLGNKIFTYLGAGIPVLLSDTEAQERLAPDLGAAAYLLKTDEPVEIARMLEDLLFDHKRISAARLHACTLATNRYNWDVEKTAFLAAISATLKSQPD